MRAPGPLTVQGLRVTYGDRVAVHDVDLVLPPGHSLAVTGPAGAGKTSLLWALAGATPYDGSVLLDDQPVTDRRAAAAMGISMVPQGNGLAAALTAEENVLVPLVIERRGRRPGPRAHQGRPRGGRTRRLRSTPGRGAVGRTAAAGRRRPSSGRARRSCCWPTNPPATWTPSLVSSWSPRCSPRRGRARWSWWPRTTPTPPRRSTPSSGSTTASRAWHDPEVPSTSTSTTRSSPS